MRLKVARETEGNSKFENTISHNAVAVVYFVFSWLPTVHAAFRHETPNLTSLTRDGGVSCFDRLYGSSPIQFLTVHSHAILNVLQQMETG